MSEEKEEQAAWPGMVVKIVIVLGFTVWFIDFLTPGLVYPKWKANETTAEANLKIIGTGQEMYYEEVESYTLDLANLYSMIKPNSKLAEFIAKDTRLNAVSVPDVAAKYGQVPETMDRAALLEVADHVCARPGSILVEGCFSPAQHILRWAQGVCAFAKEKGVPDQVKRIEALGPTEDPMMIEWDEFLERCTIEPICRVQGKRESATKHKGALVRFNRSVRVWVHTAQRGEKGPP